MADAIAYPTNINVQGLMSFPLYTLDNIDDLVAWRTKKNQAKPRYPDRIGFSLFLTQAQHDRIVKELREVYLPFAATLWGLSDKKKGIDPKLIAKLLKLVEEEDWSETNLPIRNLNDKDIENLNKHGIEGIVSKLRVAGPPQEAPIIRKALVRSDSDDDKSPLEVVSINSISERLGEQTDAEALWWGAMWPFKTSLRFNAFNAANFGVTAYVRNAYLQAEKPLLSLGSNDADILDDGDDWADED